MSRSQQLMNRALEVIPGGVNSPVRAFGAVKGSPPFIARAQGNYLFDVDGNQYLDLVGSWGPMLLGHAHPDIVQAICEAAHNGTSFGAPTEGEVLFAEELVKAHPAIQQVRLCSSGTEATMHAIRLARGFTNRDAIVKIDGCYHGAHDAVLVAAGSGVATFAKPGSAGVPHDVAKHTLTAPFNDIEALRTQLQRKPVAAVILEIVPGNMGVIEPDLGYLRELRKLTKEKGTLLIADEVMTGFRLAKGGACEFYGVEADLVCLGKIVGGGLPLAAFGGRRDIMQHLSPVGAVYQAGTLSGNPLAVAAGRAMLKRLTPDVYIHLETRGRELAGRLAEPLRKAGWSMARVGSMFTIYFRRNPPRNFEETKSCNLDAFARFHRRCLDNGVYMPPSQFEAAFLPATIGSDELKMLVDVLSRAIFEAGS